jgi:hypothetical protein
MRPATLLMTGLAVPCAANVLLWLTLFANPRLGFRDDLTFLFVAGWLLGTGCAFAGVIAVFAATKSPTVWGFLWFFGAVILLNVYGFFWSIGSAVRVIM